MPVTNTTVAYVAVPNSIDFNGNGTVVANAGTDSATWSGSFSALLNIVLQNPVVTKVVSNDYESPPSCSVFVYFDVDGVTADVAEALWQSGLLKKIDPTVPGASVRVLELKFTNNTVLSRKTSIAGATSATPPVAYAAGEVAPTTKVNIDGTSTGSCIAVPSEMYNLWKMTAKQQMKNATTVNGGTGITLDAANPRTQSWPRHLFTHFTFRLYNNIAGMTTSGLVQGTTLMAELVEASADYTTATTSDPGTSASHFVTWPPTNRDFNVKIYATST